MKKTLLSGFFTVLSILSCGVARAQYLDPRFAIYISTPLTILSKGEIKAEYRLNLQNALLLSYTQYWGFFPGNQGALEYRLYFPERRRDRVAENFIYGKAGMGFADYLYSNNYQQISILDDSRNHYAAPGTYVFAGAGIGRHYSIDWFFIDFNAGLKFAEVTTPPGVYNEHLFYLTGPGSYIDINVLIGIQF